MHSKFGRRAWDEIKNENCVAEKLHDGKKIKIQKMMGTIPVRRRAATNEGVLHYRKLYK